MTPAAREYLANFSSRLLEVVEAHRLLMLRGKDIRPGDCVAYLLDPETNADIGRCIP